MKKGTYFFVLGYPEKCVEIELNRKGGMAGHRFRPIHRRRP